MGWIRDLIYGKYNNDFQVNTDHIYPDDPKPEQPEQPQHLYLIGEALNIPACSGTIFPFDLYTGNFCSGVQIPLSFGEYNE
jgi:hypothetical protein